MRNTFLALSLALAAAGTTLLAVPTDAHACGGCFTPPENPTVVTDHRMILSIAKEQSTLYDQIRYSGSPESFAWVLPTSGTIEVGLSADIVFSALDGVTQTQIVAPPRNCPTRPSNCDSARASSAENGSGPQDAGGVSVTKREVVGPYDTVQLKATDPAALQNWLQTNGFAIPPDVQPVVSQYVNEHFDFLALKLLPGKDVNDMRPVRVTTKGASAVLPLRMVAAGTGAVVGISLWVVGEGRYEPQNFPSFVIPETELVWDWTQNKSNYTDLRAQKTAAGGGRAWETESSTILYRQQIESAIRRSYAPYPGPNGQDDAGNLTPEERAAQVDYLPVKDAQGNLVKTAVQAREEDLATLFYGIPTASSRVTRLRADLTHAALNEDLLMAASQDQSPLPTIRQVRNEVGQPLCPVWNGCDSAGQAPRDEAIARSDGGGESFSCSTAARPGSPVWMAAGAGYLAMAIARAVRRRRRPS